MVMDSTQEIVDGLLEAHDKLNEKFGDFVIITEEVWSQGGEKHKVSRRQKALEDEILELCKANLRSLQSTAHQWTVMTVFGSFTPDAGKAIGDIEKFPELMQRAKTDIIGLLDEKIPDFKKQVTEDVTLTLSRELTDIPMSVREVVKKLESCKQQLKREIIEGLCQELTRTELPTASQQRKRRKRNTSENATEVMEVVEKQDQAKAQEAPD